MGTKENSAGHIISGTSEEHTLKHVRPQIFIGIDPDISLSGFAVYSKKQKALIDCRCFKFFDLQRAIDEYDKIYLERGLTYIVHIEGGWLVEKSNFHPETNPRVREKIAKHVGSNHEAGRKIVEMCIEYDYPFIVRAPITPKFADEKIFKMITGWRGQTNKDSRSAANYVYGY